MKSFVIASLGWRIEALTVGAMEALCGAKRVILRTEQCGAAQWLKDEGIPYESLDHLNGESADFDDLTERAVREILAAAQEDGLLYGVNTLADRTVQRLMALAPDSARVIPNGAALEAMAGTNYHRISASDIHEYVPRADDALLIEELANRELAGEVKIRLLDCYPDAWTVYIARPDGGIETAALYDLDRLDVPYDHRTCALIPAVPQLDLLARYDFGHLNRIMRVLRGPDGCPWDKKQTHESLRTNMLEEAYEAIDAIDRGDMTDLYDELGDLLLQVALHAEIARQSDEFDIGDVTTAVCAKLIARHPHVFGEAQAATSEEVYTLWQRIKQKERGLNTQSGAMRRVTGGLPALMRALKALDRAKDVGIGYRADAAYGDFAGAMERLFEADQPAEQILGELVLLVVAAAQKRKIQPELALSAALDRYVDRFERMEALITADGMQAQELSPGTAARYWDLAQAL